MDLQCVLLCPQTKTSTLYYKTKLQMHNVRKMGIVTLEGSMNAPSAVSFSAVQYWCGTISNTYIHLALKHSVAGHTQMQCDSKHSPLEWRIIKDIHTPHDYIVLFETVQMHSSPYKVTQLYHKDFMKLSKAYVTNKKLVTP